jgi:hypothetical protein
MAHDVAAAAAAVATHTLYRGVGMGVARDSQCKFGTERGVFLKHLSLGIT